jgi:hypothetical protein
MFLLILQLPKLREINFDCVKFFGGSCRYTGKVQHHKGERMFKLVLAVFMATGTVAWGQENSNSPAANEKVDKATAYYHYMVAHMYSEKAMETGGRNREYVTQAIENYQAAIKADPRTPLLSEEMARVPAARVPVILFRPPAPPPNRPRP